MVRGEVAAMPWESYDDLDVLERPPARRYPSRHGQRHPNILAQWAWGLWGITWRLVALGFKMFGTVLLILVLLTCGAIWVWHHGVEAGVEKLQQTTTTTVP